MDSYFNKLNSINVQDKVEKKNGLSYLSWAYAWGELKKRFPDSTYTVYENKDGWNYFTDGKTAWVKTGVTVEDIEHIEYLPVMDYRNKSIPLENITSFDVNKAIQRSLTKAVARHGLGLYIYAGEDLPEQTTPENAEEPLSPTEIQETINVPKQEKLSLKEQIKACKSKEELQEVYQANKREITKNQELLDLVTEEGKKYREVA